MFPNSMGGGVPMLGERGGLPGVPMLDVLQCACMRMAPAAMGVQEELVGEHAVAVDEHGLGLQQKKKSSRRPTQRFFLDQHNHVHEQKQKPTVAVCPRIASADVMDFPSMVHACRERTRWEKGKFET
jgi:hypothetical protein